jgi:hypothetical protein
MFYFFHRLFAGLLILYQMLSHNFLLAGSDASPVAENSIAGVVKK